MGGGGGGRGTNIGENAYNKNFTDIYGAKSKKINVSLGCLPNNKNKIERRKIHTFNVQKEIVMLLTAQPMIYTKFVDFIPKG